MSATGWRIESRSESEHVIEFDDGVTATVQGSWHAAERMAQGRARAEKLLLALTYVRNSLADVKASSEALADACEAMTVAKNVLGEGT